MKITRVKRLVELVREYGPFLLPFAVWLYLLRGFYSSGKLIFVSDARNFFIMLRYYLDNIMRGVYPMWNPFYAWGRPTELYIRLIGEFNPFLFIPAFLNKAGLPFELSYFIFINGYYFLGLAGFYLLAKRIFNDRQTAYLALILLLFSTLGINFFNDMIILYLFVAIAWFFYCLTAFTQTRHPTFLLGLTFATMIIAVTNLPLYFLTIFLTFAVCFCILFWRSIGGILRAFAQFIKNHKLLVAFCVLSVVLSMLPGLMWYIAGSSGEYVFSQRHTLSSHTHVASMSLDTINAGGMVGPYEVHTLFSNLIDLQVGSLYVPIFAFLILPLGLIAPVTKRLVLFFTVGFLVCLIASASATPVHKFLYTYVFFFKFFRNLHFLLWLSLPFFALFLAEQFRLLLSYMPQNRREKIATLLYVFIIHLGFTVFLCYQENVIVSSYAVVALSFVFFALYFLGFLRAKPQIVLFFLLVVVALQPAQALRYLYGNSTQHTFSFSRERSRPFFSFMRPEKKIRAASQDIRHYGDFKDTSGFIDDQYIGVRWSYLLHSSFDHDILSEYLRHKFMVYDRVEWMEPGTINPKIKDTFSRGRNLAFVSSGSAHTQPTEDAESFPIVAGVVNRGSEQFKVLNFGLNFILFKTHFDTQKFLVYNDSFHSSWRATVNGKPTEIVRANIAFKGLWLPAGDNIVYLRYGQPARYYFSLFLIVFFGLFLVYLVYSFSRLRMSSTENKEYV